MSELAKVWETATIVEVYTSDGAWEQAYYALLNGHYPALRSLEQELKAEREATLSRVRQMEEAAWVLIDLFRSPDASATPRQAVALNNLLHAIDPTGQHDVGDSTHPAQGER